MYFKYFTNNLGDWTPKKIAQVLGLGKEWKGAMEIFVVPAERFLVVRGYSSTTKQGFALACPDCSGEWQGRESWKEIPASQNRKGEMRFAFRKGQFPGSISSEKEEVDLWEDHGYFELETI